MRSEAEEHLKPLSSFTPRVEGIDRDAILFAAGRESARGSRKWQVAASLLAATQAATLALLLMPARAIEMPGAIVPSPTLQIVELPALPADPSSLFVLQRMAETGEFQPEATIENATADAPLTPLSRLETIQ